ncbi:GNAT family N-acetyltransferase [Pseudomonas syringae pv. actinidiae]|uniref:N-acetyltransferase n=2 Tax=Pseudomonas syringae group TaxID=136849 RepID=A0A261WKK5_9PSED|nr:GNAT family N-acetyltransferase [Pseudomonas syringae]EPM92636.1 GNAT family acetyltransferase [Pseudomonas syringae pv. actinidiae ICMP 19070]EPN65981.1 GNAT family acetyltransferase [Pseudomonas syringae pv. actinidiae ICMP 19101]EPN72454.1 GNAT family acetyltransferase [Pseudomonas syringae pv. actinidiae ICMP 19079]OZI86512.1 N-acetyltransferase [Pseudomonas avellanae]AKT29210.1 acetyltransferase [Pseudomonas syringae pv. actinidiae ICMP 18884]
MKQVEVQIITELPCQVLILEQEAVAEGFRFLTRLIKEWRSGTNRFEAKGECLMVVLLDGALAGIGGLSRDSHAQRGIGRLRRVYVANGSRGQGLGKILVNRLVEHAAQEFFAVRLFTDTPSGAEFYLRCGFQPVDEEHATHMKLLKRV